MIIAYLFGWRQREVLDLKSVIPNRRGRRELSNDRDGALADERDRHRVGAHAVARDAAGGVAGVGSSAPSMVQIC